MKMCRFFAWYDEDNSTGTNVQLAGLLKKVEEMKEIQRMLLIGLVICIVVILLMGISLGICAVKK